MNSKEMVILRGQPIQIKQEFMILRTVASLPSRLPKGIEDIVGDFPYKAEAMPFERRIA
ncbi:MAG: hypothetical protein ACYDCB_09200 [Candidatus Dormibacteria bacterium]